MINQSTNQWCLEKSTRKLVLAKLWCVELSAWITPERIWWHESPTRSTRVVEQGPCPCQAFLIFPLSSSPSKSRVWWRGRNPSEFPANCRTVFWCFRYMRKNGLTPKAPVIERWKWLSSTMRCTTEMGNSGMKTGLSWIHHVSVILLSSQTWWLVLRTYNMILCFRKVVSRICCITPP